MITVTKVARAAAVALALCGAALSSKPAQADGGAVVAGVAGGLLLGALIGSTAHADTYYAGGYHGKSYYGHRYHAPRYSYGYSYGYSRPHAKRGVIYGHPYYKKRHYGHHRKWRGHGRHHWKGHRNHGYKGYGHRRHRGYHGYYRNW